MQYVVNRNDAEPGMATADEVERALQNAVAAGLPPLTRLYHKGKAEPTAADAPLGTVVEILLGDADLAPRLTLTTTPA